MSASTLQPTSQPNRRQRATTAGLDIGAHSAKLVVRSWRSSNWRIVSACTLRLPAEAQANATELTKVICPWLEEQLEEYPGNLVCALPSAMVDYEDIEVDLNASAAEMQATATASLQQLLGDQASQASSDYWSGVSLVGGQPEAKLHLAWTGTEFAAGLADQLHGMRNPLESLEPAPIAIARAATAGVERFQSCLAVDIGAGDATLVWVHKGIPQYVRNRIRFTDHSAAEELAAASQVSPLAAETLLASWGMGDPRIAPFGPLEASLEQHLAAWIQKLRFEISRTVDFLRHRHGPAAVPEVVLTGGGACIRGLTRCLGTKIDASVRNADLPTGWIWEAAEPFSPLYASAVALSRSGDYQ